MNQTVNILSISNICTICQTSYGFSSADRQSIIVMVVLIGIALILCYAGVLWYAIRTRFIPEDKQLIIMDNIITNEAFDNDEIQYENIEGDVKNMTNTTTATTPPVTVTSENEKERY